MRVNVEYGGGADTVFFDICRREAISYEMAVRNDVPDEDFFHSRYGGKLYYRSRTGLSGAGWYESSQAPQLIKFGWYRPDYIFGQERQQVAVTSDNYVLYGYLPIMPHEGIDHSAPAVLVQAGVLFLDYLPVVAFVPVNQVAEAIRDWHKIAEEAKLVKIPYYERYGDKLEPREFEVQFWNQHRFRGVNLVRFLEEMLDPIRDRSGLSADERNKINTTSLFSEHLHIYPVAGKWGHWNALGFCDQMWEQDPREIVGPLAEGWKALSDGIFIRLYPKFNGVQINVLCSIPGDSNMWIESFRTDSAWKLYDMQTFKQHTIEFTREHARKE